MIPEFDDNGYLPAGIHIAGRIKGRFALSGYPRGRSRRRRTFRDNDLRHGSFSSSQRGRGGYLVTLQSKRDVANTRAKLKKLEDRYAALQAKPNAGSNGKVRSWTMLSLKKLINQFKEEISRFEATRK